MADDAFDIEGALVRLARLHPKLIDLSLGRIKGLLEKLGNPQDHLSGVIHIAGTNGKGSMAAFVNAMLGASGYKVNAYTSPHLVRFNERIRLGQQLIDDMTLASILAEVEAINGDAPITFFEVTTAVALLAFARNKADFTVLETGLGGRLDATNVISKPLATIITPIALDHEQFLGTTLGKIAGEKAGIMRAEIPCFCAAQTSPEITAVLEAKAQAINAPLFLAGCNFTIAPDDKDGIIVEGRQTANGSRSLHIPKIGLLGQHQGDNCGLAAATLMHIAPDISDEAFTHGAANARWPGRFHPITHGRLKDIVTHLAGADTGLWLDCAHNAHGASALARSLKALGARPWVIVAGALNTRPASDFIKPLAPLLCHGVALAIPNQTASLTAQEMALAMEDNAIQAEVALGGIEAIEKAAHLASHYNANIIITGSLYLGGAMLAVNNTPPQ